MTEDRVTGRGPVGLEIRGIELPDFAPWAQLFGAYRQFYRRAPDDAVTERVWSWIRDATHETHALVAVSAPGTAGAQIVGFAHYRRFARPSTGTTGLWLDDLFTAGAQRGAGVGRRLIARLREIAEVENLSVVRWITAADNESAQHLYDSLATRTSWLTYDLTP